MDAGTPLKDLLKAYQGGAFKAFDLFYKRTSTSVFNYLLVRLRNQVEAEDAFQETYFRVHRYIMTYDTGKPAIAWVLGIAKNAAIDKIRSRSKFVTNLTPDELGSPSTADKVAEAKQVLAQLQLGLNDEESDLLYRRLFLEEGYDEIALAAGSTAQNIRQKVSRLLKKIRS